MIQGVFRNTQQFKAEEKKELQKFLATAVMPWKRMPAAALDSPALRVLNSGMVRVKLTA